jgi:RNA polymerase sigma factor (sigma-70 family)
MLQSSASRCVESGTIQVRIAYSSLEKLPMAHTPLADVLVCVRTMLASQRADAMTDRQLLADFVERRDEWAFAALVHRHGAMVLSVCRRTLRDATDAEDAFQATFLVLARKAASIRKAEALGNWLHHVAYRAALKLRTDRRRREQGTTPLVELAEPDNTTADVTWREVRSILDEELLRLPDAYRAPLVLCYLEGKTQDEAAQTLGWTLGTLRGRLQRGRERLRGRLARRGLPLSAVLLGATLVHANACATASAALEVSTTKAVLLAVAGESAAGAVSTQAVALANGVIQTMFISKLQTVGVLLLGLAVLGGGGLLTCRSMSNGLLASSAVTAAEVDEKTIRDLIRQLGDEDFEKRETAQQRLIELGEPALEQLRQAARDSKDAEIRQRAERAVRAIEKAQFGQVRQLTGHETRTLPLRWADRVVLTPDGRHAVSGGFDALRCWDLESGKQTLVFGDLGDSKASYWSLAISKDGRRLIGGRSDFHAEVFDVKTGKSVRELSGHTGEVWGVALSADGKQAVTGAWDQTIRVWDVDTGEELRRFEGVRDYVRCLALSSNGKLVATGHFADNGPATVRLWDLEKGKEIRTFAGHAQEVTSISFSKDGTKLLSSSFDKTVRLWDVDSGKELKRFVGHANRVEYAAFTPDGKRIVSCGNEDNPTIHIWDVASAKQLLESESVEGGFLSLVVLPEGRQCMTTGKDGIVRVWRWTR